MKIGTSKIISVTQILLGTVLLTREIYHFITLPSGKVDFMGGLVTLWKYKENTHSLIFLWTLLFITGSSMWINKKFYWILSHVLFIAILGIFFYPVFDKYLDYTHELNMIFIVFLVSLLSLIIIYKSKITTELNITPTNKVISIVLGLLSSMIYWTLNIF